ncbi:MAG: Gfo/Idh/MocA family oxidoreductase [Thiolinea sp.]
MALAVKSAMPIGLRRNVTAFSSCWPEPLTWMLRVGRHSAPTLGLTRNAAIRITPACLPQKASAATAFEGRLHRHPNGTHYAISKAALEAGLHVICEKPLTFSVAEARELQALARSKNRVFGVMYGCRLPVLHQARAMISAVT